MDHQTLLTNYLSNLEVDLFMVNYNRCGPDWRDLDYTPDYSKLYYICEGKAGFESGIRNITPNQDSSF